MEPNQIVVNKNVAVLGPCDPNSWPVIKPLADTGGSGDARGWWLVSSGNKLVLRYLILDGDAPTRRVHTAIRSWGSLDIRHCTFRNIHYAPDSYDGRAIGPYAGTNTIQYVRFENIRRIGVLVFSPGTQAFIDHCTYVGKGTGDWLDYGFEVGGGGYAKITNCTISNCCGVASSDGSTSAGILVTTYYGAGTSATVLGCTIHNNPPSASCNDTGIAIGYRTGDTSTVVAHYNDLDDCTYGIASTDPAVDAEKNWWGTTNAAQIAALVSGNVDYTPWLMTPQIHLAFGGNRLKETQNSDGGWGWPLSGSSAHNIIGPTAMGLCKAYRATGDPDLLPALQKAKTFLLAKTNTFSPPDGYLAVELDSILGGTACVNHVRVHFYGKLSNGSYQRSGDPASYNTAGFVQRIRDSRASQGYPNLAAWDLGMGLVAAASAGVTGPDLQEWINGVEAEINELNGNLYYDVIGLAGALYGLAFVGEEFDPTEGEHAAASNLSDLANILASYQIAATGGFARKKNYVIPCGQNETTQETAYAILALEEVDRLYGTNTYGAVTQAAKNWLLWKQLDTGGWDNWEGSPTGENNEVTAEAMWGIWDVSHARLTLEPDDECYQQGETVTVQIWMRNVETPVVGGQFFLTYNTAYLQLATGANAIVPSTAFPVQVYECSTAEQTGSPPPGHQLPCPTGGQAGRIDYAVGIASPGGTPQSGDRLMATITFTALQEICAVNDLITWRANDPPTRLSDPDGRPVYPMTINMDVVDNEPPVISGLTVTGANVDQNCQATVTFSATVTDNCCLDADNVLVGVQLLTANATLGTPVVNKTQDNAYTVTISGSVLVSELTGCPATVQVTVNATDCCANSATPEQATAAVNDVTPPVVTPPNNAVVECDGSGNMAALNAWLASASASDNCDGTLTPTPVLVSSVPGCCQTGVYTYKWQATDNCGNIGESATRTFTIQDTTAPTISGCPEDITVNADAGSCTAVVTWTEPTATDVCCGPVACTYRSHAPGSTFPQGTTTVRYEFTDGCNNTAVCEFNVTVNAVNDLQVTVSLAGTYHDPGPQNLGDQLELTRCITFELWRCGNPPVKVVKDQLVTFTIIDGVVSPATVEFEVPCGVYNCITARDRLHTLRRTADCVDAGTYYTASFTGTDALIGGNLNDDFWVDILDFGVFSWRYGHSYGTGNTNCATAYPHADINGDGLVDTADFTFIQANFLLGHETNCCGAPLFRGEDEAGPLTRIAVADLARYGLEHLAVADLNGDGWIDEYDVAAFASGVRPQPQPKPLIQVDGLMLSPVPVEAEEK